VARRAANSRSNAGKEKGRSCEAPSMSGRVTAYLMSGHLPVLERTVGLIARHVAISL